MREALDSINMRMALQQRVAMTTCVGQGVGKLDGNTMVERGLYLKLTNVLCISDMRETRTPSG